MAYKILHMADLHLDVPFRDLGRGSSVANARREGLRSALKGALALARARQVDALTIGGDLYEAEHISADTAQFLRQQFAAAAPLLIFITPGNHDPYTSNSPYAYVDWSSNVHIFREARLTPMTLGNDVQLWGAAHDSPAFYQPLLTSFRIPDRRPALLLLHGTDRALTLGQEKGAFCPFSLDEVRSAGFGLALLGHIHHRRFSPEANPLLCYPGSPEPLGFGEQTGHATILAEWDGHRWRTEFIDISQWRYASSAIDTSGLHSREEVIDMIRNFAAQAREGKKLVARVILSGQPGPSLDLDLEAIATSVQSEFADLRIDDQTSPPFDLKALKAEQTTTGTFVNRMLVAIAEAELSQDAVMRDKLTRGLTFGLLALNGWEIPNV